jgi:hypothetical protein
MLAEIIALGVAAVVVAGVVVAAVWAWGVERP